MSGLEVVLLLVGGSVAGVINAMAGGGSTLTVPLLVVAGVPGVEANGSNRVGILLSNIASLTSFRREGAWVDPRSILSILGPAIAGSLVGAFGVSRLTNDTFETTFGLLMIPIVLLTLQQPGQKRDDDPERYPGTQRERYLVVKGARYLRGGAGVIRWPKWLTVVVFFGIGIYAGAIQAGVGLLLVAALSRAGFDLVTANVVKVVFTLCATAIALPVFVLADQVRWIPGLIVALGLSVGGWMGARFAVRGGERWIRVVMVVAALVLAGHLLGLYG